MKTLLVSLLLLGLPVSLLALDSAESTNNNSYQVVGNWSELKRGWNTLILVVTEGNNEAVVGATITVSYDMVDMKMDPPDKPVEEKENGRYEKRVFLGMKGKWKFDTTIRKDQLEDALTKVQEIKN